MLSKHLRVDLKLSPEQIAVLHGQMSDTEQQELVGRFGRQDDQLRVLLCSDVASEGLNLHFFCNRLVHFDLPWSLIIFQQRNGRVDRYGQKRRTGYPRPWRPVGLSQRLRPISPIALSTSSSRHRFSRATSIKPTRHLSCSTATRHCARGAPTARIKPSR